MPFGVFLRFCKLSWQIVVFVCGLVEVGPRLLFELSVQVTALLDGRVDLRLELDEILLQKQDVVDELLFLGQLLLLLVSFLLRLLHWLLKII